MGSIPLMYFLLFLLSAMFHFINAANYPSSFSTHHQPLCHDDESSALLQFKQSFEINKLASTYPTAYPKVSSWKPEETNDCCLWDGVRCNGGSDHVVGIDLSSSWLCGSINSSSSLFRLVHLRRLNLADNHFNYSQIPSGFSHLPKLLYLNLSMSNFSSQIPPQILELSNLVSLDLSANPMLKIQKPGLQSLVQNLPNLKLLILSWVNISSTVPRILANLPSLTALCLRGCNVYGEFPVEIFKLPNLQFLSLRQNPDLNGYIPQFQSSSPLKILRLADTGFSGQLPNSIGNLNSLYDLDISNCTFSGLIPSSVGNLTNLIILDLSHNNFSGTLPQCLSNSSNFLKILNLRNNNLHGTIHATFMEGSRLKMIDVSQNQLLGQIPRSLSNCTMLEILHLGNNNFIDIFPSWLGNLPKLGVLILRFNRFHGAIGKPNINFMFPKLHIIDLSYNNFTGKLPSEYFINWNFMKIANVDNLTYMLEFRRPELGVIVLGSSNYLIKLTNKGVEITYQKIQEFFVAQYLSSNKFEEEIPEVIENLKGLRLLNLSNNILTGYIPSSLGNLKELESLDLSQNKLSGEVPQQLMQLTFLAFLNVSNNYLVGPIPQGNQFATFQNDSYVGNTGLCGIPLTKKCKESETLPQPPLNSKEGKGSSFPSTSDWIVIIMGYGSGLIIGWVIGFNVTVRKFDKFIKNFQRR